MFEIVGGVSEPRVWDLNAASFRRRPSIRRKTGARWRAVAAGRAHHPILGDVPVGTR